MAAVYIALGSNIGDSAEHIARAITLLEASITDLTRAPLYTSKAVGYTEQPDFLNTVVRGQTALSPEQLLAFAKGVEQQVGRIARFRWGPREIDIDIIFYDDLVLESDALIIPHPRFAERDFVLRPLCDLDPQLIDPVSNVSVEELVRRLPKGQLSILQILDS
jgi:2-amino-4-hydroxy-6-hydroxymethyldihydropteridine diphosphokinase